MSCPRCKKDTLDSRNTKQGVAVELCSQCGGVWLDSGKVFKFHKQPQSVAKALQAAVGKARATERLSPKTNQPMRELPLLGGKLTIDVCPQTKGLWFDKGKLAALGKAVFNESPAETPQPEQKPAASGVYDP